ncbi:hypothetical protein GOV04_05330 [Candidatus Woesearchaeota archaeon]|nr:hypothetical protein [Candidatus Woesearchaeota archaeon]
MSEPAYLGSIAQQRLTTINTQREKEQNDVALAAQIITDYWPEIKDAIRLVASDEQTQQDYLLQDTISMVKRIRSYSMKPIDNHRELIERKKDDSCPEGRLELTDLLVFDRGCPIRVPTKKGLKAIDCEPK